MKIELNTLKYAKMLSENGFEQAKAATLMEWLVSLDIRNIYSKDEVNTMLSESVEKVFRNQKEVFLDQRENFKRGLDEQRREFDKRMELYEHQIDSEIAEGRSGRRWVLGTIVTCSLALAGYLSALIHLTH